MLNRLYYAVMFTLLVWGINICVPVHAQNKLDSLQHLNEVVVTARAVQKEIFPELNRLEYYASSPDDLPL